MIRLLGTRWRKVLRDIWGNKARTILVVLAIAVGVFAFGSVFITQDVLLKDMNKGYVSSNPPNVIVNLSPFDESLVRTVRTFPGVAQAEARAHATVKLWDGLQWRTLDLIAVPDFAKIEIGKITLQEQNLRTLDMAAMRMRMIDVSGGSLTPARRDLLIERRSIIVLPDTGIGDQVTIELPDGSTRQLRITGIVHDFNAQPGNIAPTLAGYVTIDTLRQLGLSVNYDEISVVASPEYDTDEELESLAEDLERRLDKYGYDVQFSQVQRSDEHWAADLVNALVAVLGAIGFLALALSGLLVFNTVTAILAAQTRQIGMMKTVGAKGRDILVLYSVMAVTFGVLSLLVALPVGMLVSLGLTHALGFFLNVNITEFKIPAYVLGLQFLTAIVTPLIAAAVPIYTGTRITVREAVSDYGIGTSAEAKGLFASIGRGVDGIVYALLRLARFLSRPSVLSLRNTFRRKMRLLLTLITLSLAGAIFISVLDVRGSLLGEFDKILSLFGYDMAFILTEPQPVTRLQREAERVDSVRRVEGWGFAQGTYVRPDGEDGLSFFIFAPPADTPFIKPDIIEGRWLIPGDTNAIVIGSEILKSEPDIHVGDLIELDLGNSTRRMQVVGIVNLVGIEFAYADFDYITQAQGAAGLSFVSVVGLHSPETNPMLDALGIQQSTLAFQSMVGREIEEQYKTSGISVLATQITEQLVGTLQSSVNVLVGFMLFMALLLAVVGGLGLTSTMSLNVLERTREIGVMRSIGASDQSVRTVFLTEGLVIGFMSWMLATALSLPIATQFAASIGMSFFDRPLDFVFVPSAPLIWLVAVMLISAAASLAPANRASQVSVRESLAYE